MTRPPSKQKLLYQQAWRKAVELPDGLRLNFRSEAGAFEARKHLYEAVREARLAPMDFPDLFRAAEQIQIVRVGDTGLWMRHRDTNDAIQGMEAALGLSIKDMMDEGELESLKKLQELQERIKGKQSEDLLDKLDNPDGTFEHKENPFFDKRS